MWTPIITALQQNQNFIISSHLNPDCDALGSELALAYQLRAMDKTVTILNTDPVPKSYQFLDPMNLIKQYSRAKHSALLAQVDVVIVLDASGGWRRMGRAGEDLSRINALTICIDHHPDNKPFTDLAVVNPNVIATGELIFELISTMQGTISKPMAQALYAAILTDSGSFRFSKTSPNTHRITARLLEYGVSPAEIYQELYEKFPLSKVHLKGYVLLNTQLTAGGQIAYIDLTAHMLQSYDVLPSDLDGFSSLPQQIDGVRVVILLVELPRNRIKISLRSDGSVTVNKIAAQFGGGGHVPAAGAVVNGDIEEVMTQVLIETERYL